MSRNYSSAHDSVDAWAIGLNYLYKRIKNKHFKLKQWANLRLFTIGLHDKGNIWTNLSGYNISP
jgi:hypothetical protein